MPILMNIRSIGIILIKQEITMNETTIFDYVKKEESIFEPKSQGELGKAHHEKVARAEEELRVMFANVADAAGKRFLNTWKEQYRNAKGLAAKTEILNKRDEYLAAERAKAYAEQVLAEEREVEAILALPVSDRNKVYYEQLKQNKPLAYHSQKVQAQLKKDKSVLGLLFHMKGK